MKCAEISSQPAAAVPAGQAAPRNQGQKHSGCAGMTAKQALPHQFASLIGKVTNP
jgi:hypothetical protein